MKDLDKTVATMEQILLQEQQSRITSRSDLGASQLRRKELETLLNALYEPYERLFGQVRDLPAYPDERVMDWAEWALSLPNLAILALDTTGLDSDADIIGISALDAHASPLMEITIAPQRQHTANTAYTGITEEELAQSLMIGDVWPHVRRCLRGRFVISFNLEFVETRLKENIAHYGLDRLPLRGDCLMKQSMRYFQINRYGWKLAEACSRIGHTLPSPALAQHRAAAQLALLKAMSNGVTSAPKKINAETSPDELEDHPF